MRTKILVTAPASRARILKLSPSLSLSQAAGGVIQHIGEAFFVNGLGRGLEGVLIAAHGFMGVESDEVCGVLLGKAPHLGFRRRSGVQEIDDGVLVRVQ